MGGEAKRKARWARAQGELEWVVKGEDVLVILREGDPTRILHVMPARRAPDYEDPYAARNYMIQVKKAGDPVLMFGPAGAEHLYVHCDHKPSPDCRCKPKWDRKGEEVIYTHNVDF